MRERPLSPANSTSALQPPSRPCTIHQRIAAEDALKTRNSSTSVQTTVTMPPIQVQATANAVMSPIDSAMLGMPLACSQACRRSPIRISSTTAVR